MGFDHRPGHRHVGSIRDDSARLRRRRCGGGTVPGTVDAMAAHVLAFLDGVGMATCDVLGFSLGGMVAQRVVCWLTLEENIHVSVAISALECHRCFVCRNAASSIPALKAERWVNSAPLTAETLHGKVVLIDFWEYTCVNWIRTAPYVKAWNRDYGPRDLIVVGVHAAEFDFGKRPENIDRGIRDHGLTYPIALDNDFAIWRTLRNDAWSAKYLFDSRGRLVRRWVGEGSYDEIEREIRRLLVVAAQPAIHLPAVSEEASTFAKAGQPSYRGIMNEMYIGAERREPGVVTLKGDWHTDRQYAELKKGSGQIVLPCCSSRFPNPPYTISTQVSAALARVLARAVRVEGRPRRWTCGRGQDVHQRVTASV